MISKQLFCKAIEDIRKQDAKMHEFDAALNFQSYKLLNIRSNNI